MIDLTPYLLMSAAVNRGVELVKRLPWFGQIPEQWQPYVVYLTSLVLGVVIVVGAGASANLLAANEVYGKLSPLAGQLITGLIVGAGSNSLAFFGDLFGNWREATKPTTPAANITAAG